MLALVPLEESGPILLVSIGVIVALIYSYPQLRKKTVGRFLPMLKLAFVINLAWQVASLVYFMTPFSDELWYNISGTTDFVLATSYAVTVVYLNVAILDAFEVITNIPQSWTQWIRYIALILFVTNHFLHHSIYYGNLWLLHPALKPAYIMFAIYCCALINGKTIYLLRLLYQDKLRVTDIEAPEQIETTLKKYQKLQTIFIAVSMFDFSAMILWSLGHLGFSYKYTKMAETMVGVELLFYPYLICGFRDLRFDKRVISTKIRTKTTMTTLPTLLPRAPLPSPMKDAPTLPT